MKLDLGCGQNVREGFTGIDIVKTHESVIAHDLMRTPWPIESNVVTEMYSSHFIEHIPAMRTYGKDLFFAFFDEAFRVAKPDCVFNVRWPALQSVRAFQDPTHRRYIPLETIDYLSIDGRVKLGVNHYNVNCNWEIIEKKTYRDGRFLQFLNEYAPLTSWNIDFDHEVTLRAAKSFDVVEKHESSRYHEHY